MSIIDIEKNCIPSICRVRCVGSLGACGLYDSNKFHKSVVFILNLEKLHITMEYIIATKHICKLLYLL